jgi:archaellum component FlaC
MEEEKERPEAEEETGSPPEIEPENGRPEGEPESSNDTATRLEEALSAREKEIAGLKNSLDGLRTESNGLSESLARAVAAYRELVLQANPDVPAELISGNNIDEINDSLKNARSLVSKVRQEIEVEASRARIPAGAPLRTAQDLASLSPREKIQRALGGPNS